MVTCTNCGKSNPRGSGFCIGCGEKLPASGVNCPMCGDTNPAERVYCQNCGARLAPMLSAFERETGREPPRPSGAPPHAEAPVYRGPIHGDPLDEEDAERGEAPGGTEPESSTSEDWLDDLRASTGEESRPEPAVSPGPPVRSLAEADSEPLEPVDIPDWLSSMGPIEERKPTTPGGETGQPFEASGEWATSEERLPDEPPLAAADIPQWLREFAPDEDDAQAEAVTPLEDDEFLEPPEFPDWLRSMGPIDEGKPPTPRTEAGLPSEAPEERVVSEERPPEEPQLVAADFPQWLREFAPDEDEAQAEAGAPFEDDEFLEPPEFPDWLRDLGPLADGSPTAPAEDPPTAEEPVPTASIGLQTRPLAPEEVAVLEQAEEPERWAEPDLEEGPAWLRDIASSPERDETPFDLGEAPADEPVSTAIRIPDWLKEPVGTEAEPAPGAQGAQEPLSTEEQLPPGAAELKEEALPAPDEAEVPPEPALESEELPNWLREPAGVSEETGPEPDVPFMEDRPATPSVPAWLTEILAEPAGVTDQDALPPAEAALEDSGLGAILERAKIPDWLQELRPRDSQAQVAVTGPMETDGLLQGLRGLLPGSFAAIIPPTHGGRLSVAPDRASLARAKLLQSLLGQPISPRAPLRRAESTSIDSPVVRRVVAIVLLITVLGTLVAPLMVRGVPQLTQPVATSGALGLYEVVDDLSPGDDVLVAFDYGAPEADELNAVARPILQHAIDQGASVSIVSTRPDGTSVASALMSELASSPDQYAVLNYRPGAATAVSQLLTATDQPPALLLVLTGRVVPLRRWVEQARVHYGDQLPVALAGSAALEPAASPYADANAKQVIGSVQGLRGAASYELLRGTRGDATQRLNALAAGHMAIIMLILVGAVFQGVARFRGAKT